MGVCSVLVLVLALAMLDGARGICPAGLGCASCRTATSGVWDDASWSAGSNAVHMCVSDDSLQQEVEIDQDIEDPSTNTASVSSTGLTQEHKVVLSKRWRVDGPMNWHIYENGILVNEGELRADSTPGVVTVYDGGVFELSSGTFDTYNIVIQDGGRFDSKGGSLAGSTWTLADGAIVDFSLSAGGIPSAVTNANSWTNSGTTTVVVNIDPAFTAPGSVTDYSLISGTETHLALEYSLNALTTSTNPADWSLVGSGTTLSLRYTPIGGGAACGNGDVEGAEDCDETVSGCCSNCTFAAAQMSCPSGDACIENKVCDGAGVCVNGTDVCYGQDDDDNGEDVDSGDEDESEDKSDLPGGLSPAIVIGGMAGMIGLGTILLVAMVTRGEDTSKKGDVAMALEAENKNLRDAARRAEQELSATRRKNEILTRLAANNSGGSSSSGTGGAHLVNDLSTDADMLSIGSLSSSATLASGVSQLSKHSDYLSPSRGSRNQSAPSPGATSIPISRFLSFSNGDRTLMSIRSDQAPDI